MPKETIAKILYKGKKVKKKKGTLKKQWLHEGLELMKTRL